MKTRKELVKVVKTGRQEIMRAQTIALAIQKKVSERAYPEKEKGRGEGGGSGGCTETLKKKKAEELRKE